MGTAGRRLIAMQPPKWELFHLAGEYLEVQPPSAWPTGFAGSRPTLTTTRRWRARHCARDGATEVALTQGPFATAARCELHKAGWTDLARLASHLAQA